MILDGRVGIITGAAQGIGRAYALGAAAQGARVVVCDVADSDGTVKEIEAAGGQALGLPGDVTSEPSMLGVADAALQRFGRIDFLVNNAALYGGLELKYWQDITLEEFDRVMAVNVRGMFIAAKAVAPTMTAQGEGKIINISSVSALAGTVGALHYVTSKGAVIGFTRALARELGGSGISVNTITPGFTLSDASRKIMAASGIEGLDDLVVAQQCLKRSEQPEDLVGAMIFLASSLSDFVTGQIINVDGGYVLH